MVEIPKRGGWGGGPLFGKNSQIIPYFFSEAFPYLGSDNNDKDGGNDRAEKLMIWQDKTSLVRFVVVRPWYKCCMRHFVMGVIVGKRTVGIINSHQFLMLVWKCNQCSNAITVQFVIN